MADAGPSRRDAAGAGAPRLYAVAGLAHRVRPLHLPGTTVAGSASGRAGVRRGHEGCALRLRRPGRLRHAALPP